MQLPFFRFVAIGVSTLLLLFRLYEAAWSTEEAASPNVSLYLLKGSLDKTETLSLTLEEVLKMAETSNPTLQAAGGAVNEARARYRTRLAELLPDIELAFTNSRYDGALQTFTNEVIDVNRRTYQPQFLFRFPIFQGGRRVFQARSAKRSLDAQQANQQTTHQQTLRQAALSYYELKRRLEGITIAQKELEESQAQLELNVARMNAGVGTRLDVLQSEAQVARANSNLLEAVKSSEIAALRLNEILDLPAFAAVLPGEAEQQMQTLVSREIVFPTLLEIAQQNRPELKSLAKQIEAMIELRKVLWSAALPEVNVEVRTGSVGAGLDNLGSYGETKYALGFTFRNLLASTLTRSRENEAQLEQLRHRMEATGNAIERELSEAYLQAATKLAQIAAVQAELVAAEQALSDAMERLRVGVGRNIDVLNAETSLTQARISLSSNILEYNQAQVELVYSLGLASVKSLTQGIQLP